MKDVSALLLRDFEDLTRDELIARAKYLTILRYKVAYSRDHFSPRQTRAFTLAILMLVMTYALTQSVLAGAVAGLMTLAGVLHFSRLPGTWCSERQDGVARLESLRRSLLLRLTTEHVPPDADYAMFCLEEKISLIHEMLSHPAKPFNA